MDLIENWIHIFEQHDEVAIIPYLKGLTVTQKKDLLPQISKTATAYLELKDRLINGKHFYSKKASRKQERILNYSIFVTVPNRLHSSYKWLNASVVLTCFVNEHILPWYCPEWFSDYVNELEKLDFISLPMTYELVMEMMDKKYLQPSELLITKLLVPLIYPKVPNQKWQHQFQPQNLTVRPYTLKTHFWYLFKYPTRIYSCETQLLLAEEVQPKKHNWFVAIKEQVEARKIDRIRLLKACLTAMNKPIFNKRQIAWFIGLFEFMSPNEMELIVLQEALIVNFRPSNSRATNATLKAIHKIVDNPDFNLEPALVNFDKLVTSKAKSVVLNTLNAIEKIGKKHIEKRPVLCEIVAKSFSNRTIDIQYKAAKFIQNYGQTHQQRLKALILPNKSNLLHRTKTILEDVLGDEIVEEFIEGADNQIVERGAGKLIKEKNRMPSINDFEEFFNLAIQIFENKRPYHFDQFIANILVFQKEIKGENIGRLLPLFRRAYQLVFNELPSNHGMLDNILATFLLDFSDLLIGRYPADSQGLQALASSYAEQGFYINDQSIPFDLNYTHLNRWYNPFDPSQVYTPIKLLLENVLTLLQHEKKQPLLSTPTHAPSWINPLELINRLVVYQNKKLIPNTIDFQIAISRVAFENEASVLKLAEEKLKGHYLSLIKYLITSTADVPLTKKANSNSTRDYEWIVAAITKNSRKAIAPKSYLPTMDFPATLFTGNHKWMVFEEERQMEDWNYKTQKLEPIGKSFIQRELQVKVPKEIDVESHPNFLYQYFPGSTEAFRPNVNDLKRLLGMLPNNPSPLIALLVADNLKYDTFWEALAKKRVVEMIDWLAAQHHLALTPPLQLFLATAMLCADKKIRLKASEIWVNKVAKSQLDSIIFGTTLGRLENKELVPLKRFTDVAQDHLLNISKVHNIAFEKTIANLLAKLPPIPIKYTKQLLILYWELLASNKSTIKNERLLVLLVLWEESPSLRKVLKTLREYKA